MIIYLLLTHLTAVFLLYSQMLFILADNKKKIYADPLLATTSGNAILSPNNWQKAMSLKATKLQLVKTILHYTNSFWSKTVVMLCLSFISGSSITTVVET